MSSSIRILAREESGTVRAKVIIPHPNESGTRKDDLGNFVSAHFIKEGTVSVNGNLLLEIQLGPSVSKDPFLQFKFTGKSGDLLKVSFLDNKGEIFSGEAVVQ
jgi:sulfur-oxidizing protein SoxZ